MRVSDRGFRLRLHGGNKIFTSPVEKVKFVLCFEESGSILIFHSVISFFVLFTSLAPGWKLKVRLIHGSLSSQLQINGLILEKIIGFDAVHTHAMLDNLLILIFLLLLMEIFLVDSWTSLQRDLQLCIFLLQTSVDHNYITSSVLLFWKYSELVAMRYFIKNLYWSFLLGDLVSVNLAVAPFVLLIST